MKWNGRSYRPIAPTFRVYVNNTNRPSSDSTSRPKKLPVWRSVMSVQPDTTTPVPTSSPTPTPSITPTLTQTPGVSPSSTPTTTPTNTPSVSVSVSPSLTPSITPSISPSISPSVSPTPTITPTSSPIPPSPSVTATSTPTPTPTPQGVSEAQTYMSAVIAGGGTLDATSSGATYQLFYDLFNYGLWNKLYSFYPLLGGNSSGGQSVNGKTPGTRNITWNGGLTFSTNGVVSNGSTGYGDLNSNPNSIGTLNDFHMSFYSRTNQQQATDQFDMGVYEIAAQRTQVNARSSVDDTRGVVNAQTQGTFSNNNSQGLFTITRRTSTDTEFYRNSTSLGNSATTSTSRPNGDLFLMARNWIGTGLAESPTTRQYAFVTIGTKLTDSEVSNLYTTIQNFQTTLGRQV